MSETSTAPRRGRESAWRVPARRPPNIRTFAASFRWSNCSAPKLSRSSRRMPRRFSRRSASSSGATRSRCACGVRPAPMSQAIACISLAASRASCCKTAPREFTLHARNPARDVRFGGDATVFSPVGGPPFVYDLDRGRRYGTLEDLQNFIKLAHMAPAIHFSGGCMCEPMEIPPNKRHLDVQYSFFRYSDQGCEATPETPGHARDAVGLARALVRRRISRDASGRARQYQFEFAAHFRRAHARCIARIRGSQSGHHHRARGSGGRHGPGNRRGLHVGDPGRNIGGDGA